MSIEDAAGASQLRRSFDAVAKDALEANDVLHNRTARLASGLAGLAHHWHLRQEQAMVPDRRMWTAIIVLAGVVAVLTLAVMTLAGAVVALALTA